ncbi:MAG: SCO family protein [Woeseiaceae bacterium]|nr:SCO family protein [Woeseiaceae bacterium]
MRKIVVILLVVTAIVGGAVFMRLALQAPQSMPQRATMLQQPLALPAFKLRDHNGEPFDNESFNGNWSLVFFGFTNCPDICPATLQQLSIARKRVMQAGESGFPDIVLISVDPERDTPEVMASYVANFGEGITGVTGSLEEIHELTSSIGIYFHKSTGGDGHQDVQHSAAVLVINKSGEMSALFSAPHRIDHFVNDIPLLMGSG